MAQIQKEPERVEMAISHIESRLIQMKYTLEAMLTSLDRQEQVQWPDMINQFSSLASEFSAIQATLKKSAIPSGVEDNGLLLKSHLIVPQRVSLEPDAYLQNASEGRLVSWNHEVLPIFLRTKLNLDIEEDEKKLEGDRTTRQSDQIAKQIQAFNKHIESLCTKLSLNESARQPIDRQKDTTLAYSRDETKKIIKAINFGTGLSVKTTNNSGGISESLNRISSTSSINNQMNMQQSSKMK